MEEICTFDSLAKCGVTIECDNCENRNVYRWVWQNSGLIQDHTSGSGKAAVNISEHTLISCALSAVCFATLNQILHLKLRVLKAKR